MDKNKENTIVKVLIMIIVIIMVFVILLFSGKLDFIINKNIKDNINSNNNIEYADNNINDFLGELARPLGWLVVRHTYSQNANREGINYLSSNEDKEVLVFEYILLNPDNNQNFIVLNAANNEITDDEPISANTKAYYPYTLFNEEYKRLFNEDFDINTKILPDGNNNEYDNSLDYVYYPNSHPGADELYVESINLIDMKFDKDTRKYTANVNIIFSERLANDIGMKDEKAQMIYYLNDENIIMESFIVGTDL